MYVVKILYHMHGPKPSKSKLNLNVVRTVQLNVNVTIRNLLLLGRIRMTSLLKKTDKLDTQPILQESHPARMSRF